MKTIAQNVVILALLSLIMGSLAPGETAPASPPIGTDGGPVVPDQGDAGALPALQAYSRWADAGGISQSGQELSSLVAQLSNTAVEAPMAERQYRGLLQDLNSAAIMAQELARRSPGGRQSVLVVPGEGAKAEELAATIRDTHVMCRILDSTLRQPGFVGGVFYDFGDFFGRDSHPIQAVYVQGYGVLFFMEVSFPLTPPSKTEPEGQTEKTEEGIDPVWREAELGLFSPQERNRSRLFVDLQQKYHPDKLEQLKVDLTKVLRHASNIRNMGADELIILSVTGAMQGSGGVPPSSGSSYPGSSSWHGRYAPEPSSERGGLAPLLTIRAKRADVDAFGKSALDFDRFRERVQCSLVDVPLLTMGAQPSRAPEAAEPVPSPPKVVH